MTPEILTIIASTSSVISLLALISFFFYSYRVREIEKSERSVKEIVEGEGLFNPEQVVQILHTLTEDGARLKALETIGRISNQSAERIYNKIKGNVDLRALENTRAAQIRKASVGVTVFFGFVAAFAVISSFNQNTSPNTAAAPETKAIDEKLTARVAACIVDGVRNYEAEQTTEVRGGATAPAPGISGGRNTRQSSICHTVGPDQEILDAQTREMSCFGGRCSVTAPKFAPDKKGVCVTATAWSESRSFGGGGSGQYALTVRFKNIATEAIRADLRTQCEAKVQTN